MMPKRIQRKRTKGWRMPEGAVYVGRPTKWGNPYYTAEAYGRWLTTGPYFLPHCFDERKVILDSLHELKGKDLACWCPEGEPCHADVLLKLANQEAE